MKLTSEWRRQRRGSSRPTKMLNKESMTLRVVWMKPNKEQRLSPKRALKQDWSRPGRRSRRNTKSSKLSDQ